MILFHLANVGWARPNRTSRSSEINVQTAFFLYATITCFDYNENGQIQIIAPSTSGELLSRVTECFYSGGDLTVNELMKQIDDYMDYYNWGAMQFENKKLGPVYIQNPAYAERLKRFL